MSDQTPNPPENLPQPPTPPKPPQPPETPAAPEPAPEPESNLPAKTEQAATRDPGVPTEFQPPRIVLRPPSVGPKGLAVEIEMRLFTKDGLQETYHYAHLINSALSAPNVNHASRQFKRYFDITKEDIMRDMEHFFLQQSLSQLHLSDQDTDADDQSSGNNRGFFGAR